MLVLATVCGIAFQASGAESVDEYLQEGNHLRSAGKYEEALGCYNKAIDLDPMDACLHHDKAWCFQKLRRYEEALGEYATATDLVCRHENLSHEEMAYILLKLHRYPEALEHADMAVGLMRNDRMRAYLLRGEAYGHVGRPKDAMADFAEAEKLDPTNFLPNAYKTKTNFRLGRYKQGFDDLLQANKLLMNDASIYAPFLFGWMILLSMLALKKQAPERWRRWSERSYAWSVRRKLCTENFAVKAIGFECGRGGDIMLVVLILLLACTTVAMFFVPVLILS